MFVKHPCPTTNTPHVLLLLLLLLLLQLTAWLS
jgi:hypothetical protein